MAKPVELTVEAGDTTATVSEATCGYDPGYPHRVTQLQLILHDDDDAFTWHVHGTPRSGESTQITVDPLEQKDSIELDVGRQGSYSIEISDVLTEDATLVVDWWEGKL